MRAAVTVVTWNIQGLADPDPAAIARRLRALRPDVVLLQEVQRAQLRAIAKAAGFTHRVWRFKHWPVKRPAEGHGILTHAPILHCRSQTLSTREAPWSWRRRIAIHAVVATQPAPLSVIDTHLGSGVPGTERVRQAGVLMSSASHLAVIGGDLNTHPGSATLRAFAAQGWVDAWARRHPGEPDPMTNWHGGRHHPPNQRLDYVLVPPGFTVEHVEVPDEWQALAELSDHTPVCVRLHPGP